MDAAPAQPPPHAPVSRRRATKWNLFFNYTVLLLTIVRNFALVPLFFAYIGDLEYSAWLASGSIAVQLLAIDFGIMGAMSQLVAAAYGAKDHQQVEKLVGTGLVIALGISVFVGVIGMAIAFVIPGTIGITGPAAERISWAFLGVSVANGIQLIAIAIRGILNSLQRPFGPGVHNVLSEIIALIATVIFLLLGFRLHSIALGMLIRAGWNTLANLVQLHYIYRRAMGLRFRWDGALCRRLWQLSAYQFFAQMAWRLNASLPPYFVGTIIGPQPAAAFVLTMRAHDMIRTIAVMVGAAINPSLTHLYGEGNRTLYKSMMLERARIQMLFGGIAILGVVALNEPFVRLWVGAENFAGQHVNILAGLSVLVALWTSLAYDALYCMGSLRFTSLLVTLESIVRLGAMVPLVFIVGIWGVPFAATVVPLVATNIPFTAALRRWLGYTTPELRTVGVRWLIGLLMPAAATIVTMMFEEWISTWARFVIAMVLFSAAGSAVAGMREWKLLRSGLTPRSSVETSTPSG